jgi:hypothetical protein
MKDLKDFVLQRRATLQADLVQMRDQIKELQRKAGLIEADLAELNKAAKALGIVNGLPTATKRTKRQSASLTIKRAVMEVLEDHPDGLLALDILGKINERHGSGLVRTSLSPQLSRLKQEGKLKQEGTLWLLAEPKLPQRETAE